jgi:rubrerythrin
MASVGPSTFFQSLLIYPSAVCVAIRVFISRISTFLECPVLASHLLFQTQTIFKLSGFLPHDGSRIHGRCMVANIIEKAEDYVSSAKISHDVLRDKLSEFLAVERGGLKLYERALQIVKDSAVSQKFREFREQTRTHESILLRVISQLGMDPTYVSPGAKVAQEKAEALLNTMSETDGLAPKAVEINAIENIVLAETKDHADWEMLGKIARQSDDPKLRDVLKPAVSEVEPQEDEHLNWTKEQMARLEFAAIAKK